MTGEFCVYLEPREKDVKKNHTCLFKKEFKKLNENPCIASKYVSLKNKYVYFENLEEKCPLCIKDKILAEKLNGVYKEYMNSKG